MNRSIHIYSTSVEGNTPSHQELSASSSPDAAGVERNVLNVYPHQRYQMIHGFGGAITESVGHILSSMPPEVSESILRSCFSTEGLAYRMIRTSLDSCDFSLSEYTAIGPDGTFSIDRDEKTIIPWIARAYQIAGSPFPVMLSPWSPPAAMKTTGKRTGGGSLRPECRDQWASYICRYIKAYRSHGIHVGSITIQNEPQATQEWESCIYSAQEERAFLMDHLYPSLQREGLDDIEIFIYDHNKERMFDHACICIDETTESMITGIAFHWYSGDHFSAVNLVHERFPSKRLIFSEGCIEYSRFRDTSQLTNAQTYGHDIIGNLNAGMDTFIDWNIVLERYGGPNHCDNFCEAPIFVELESGKVIYNLSYSYIWHFSHFIRPGALRVATTVFDSSIESVACMNPDGSLVVIIMNRKGVLQKINLRIEGYIHSFLIPQKSIVTVVLS